MQHQSIYFHKLLEGTDSSISSIIQLGTKNHSSATPLILPHLDAPLAHLPLLVHDSIYDLHPYKTFHF